MQPPSQPLQNLVDVLPGHPLRGAVDDLPEGEVGVIQMRNIDPDLGVEWSKVARVTLPASRRTDFLQPGDVVFSTRGGRNYGTCLEELPIPSVCSPHFFVLRGRAANLNPRFLAWHINQAPTQDHLQRHATGSFILNIRREVVEQLPICLPPLSVQGLVVELAEAARREKLLLSALVENRAQQMETIAARLLAQASE